MIGKRSKSVLISPTALRSAAQPHLPLSVNSGPREHGFRAKLLTYLNEQRALAEAEIAGQPFHATKKVTRTNETGEKVVSMLGALSAKAGSPTPPERRSSSCATAASRWNLPRA